MITDETVLAAVEHLKFVEGSLRLRGGDGWLCTRAFAFRANLSAFPALRASETVDMLGALLSWTKGECHVLRELPQYRIAPKWSTRLKPAVSCEGCECGACEGVSGKSAASEDYLADHGQAVFATREGRQVAVDPVFAALLAGYSVVQFGEDERAPLLGLDEEGNPIVAVMPLNCEVRRPATHTEVA